MKKTLLLLVLIPMFSFGQNYSMIPVSLALSDLTNSTSGGGSGSISITNNILTVSFSAGWNTAPMKLGIIKNLNISPAITLLELGEIKSPTAPQGYFAKIDNNKLVFYVKYFTASISSCSLSFTKNFASVPTLDKIVFSYDAAGNQINRYLCISCPTGVGRMAAPKEITALTEEDLQKFSTEDLLSYYPNPVKEELYLKWELIGDKTVASIYLYGMNGQVLKNYDDLGKTNALNIPFANYPSGTYLVALVYSDGEQKTIKIVK